MKTAVITGANRGIGLELVRALKSQYRIVAVCRSSSSALQAEGVEIVDHVDVATRDGIARLASQLSARSSARSIELLINNAGVMRPSDLTTIETDLDDWRLQYEVNALSPLRVTAALIDRLTDGAKVVIITSRMGSIGDNTSGGAYAYRMSKAAVNSAAASLAQDLRPRNIAVGLLHPGYVRTDMTGGSGFVDAEASAADLAQRIAELDPSTSGRFQHANGDILPW